MTDRKEKFNVSKAVDAVLDWLPEYKVLKDAQSELKEKNLVKGDNYYHRLGMCKAAQLKNEFWPSDKIAMTLGVLKEADDLRKKLHWSSLKSVKGYTHDFLPNAINDIRDSIKDIKNNADGIRLGLQNPDIDCRILLKDFDYRSNQWKKPEE